MKRRDFVQLCAASAVGVTLPDAARAEGLTARTFERALLVDEKREPLRLAALATGANYVFDYPFAATPCFLLRLDRPTAGGIELTTQSGAKYRWEGGVGPGQRVVAYSAICAHKMAYPAKQVTFIGYRHDPSPVAGPGRVITCCSDRSVYDPSAGARVVSGPARQPLATILLEHDANADTLHAVGTFGGDMFDAFFRKYDFKLQLEMGPRARATVGAATVVKTLEEYSAQWAKC